jgi:leader peptidase (prepilin peptidase)/N-methyltransferase
VWFATTASLPPLPPWYLYSFAFIVGATIGSFLNVCILRIPEEGVSIFYPRNSRCPQCENPIQWYDNIPILSYIMLRGQCRNCALPISLQYPLVELVTAIMAVAVVKRFGPTLPALVLFGFVCALIVVTFIDMAYWIIPDEISLPGIPLGILAAWLLGPPMPTWQEAAIGALAGGGLFLFISLFYEYVMKRPGLGMGDVKLLAMIGAFLGWRALPGVILLASAQGLVVAIVLYFFGVRKGVPDVYDDEEEEHAAKDEADGAKGEPETAEAKEEGKADEPEAEQQETAAKESSEESNESSEESEESEDSSEDDSEVGFRAVAIQFGPFLCLAALEVLFWGKQIAVWYAKLLRF